jgi:ribose 5-phosphate isomerase B
MKLYIGADHNGFDLKAKLLASLQKSGYDVQDMGDAEKHPDDDFPQFAAKAVTALKADGDTNSRAVLICGSGQGMCMAANRYKGIRASLVWNTHEAHAARNDDDSNVLCLPARSITTDEAIVIAEAWLRTPFAGAPRFKRRIAELDQLG